MKQGSAHPAQTGNNAGLLSDNHAANGLKILNNGAKLRMFAAMKQIVISWVAGLGLALSALALSAGAAQAGCYADYKAKRDNPLKLHYGVMQVSGACNAASARAELAARLKANGWILLNMLSVFDESGLDKRKASAGQYFLRF